MFVLRKIGLSLLALLAVVPSLAETGKVLMRIDGKEVTDTELEAYYSRSPVRSRETPQRYFNHFLFFKLKVADALSMGWDTLPEFKQQYHVLSGEMLKPVLVKRQEMKAFFQHQYQEEKSRLLTNTWVRTEFLTLPLSQHPAKAEEDQAQSLMDSAYVALQNGMTFSELTSRYVSQKPQLKSGTMWMSLVGLVPELAERLQNLDEGVVSRPFYSPVGMHIVRLLDRKDGRDFRDTYPMLQAYCDRRLDGVPVLNEDCTRPGRMEVQIIRLRLSPPCNGCVTDCWLPGGMLVWEQTNIFSPNPVNWKTILRSTRRNMHGICLTSKGL